MKYTIYSLLLIFLSCNTTPDTTKQTSKISVIQNQSKPLAKPPIVKDVKTVLGIDVSHYQGDVNWKDVKQDSVLFGYAKATQGGYYSDPKFQENWRNMSANGIYKGAYHFFMYEDDAVTQAQHFLSTIKNTKSELPPVLDLESAGIDGKVDVTTYQKNVMTWLNIVEKEVGTKPIIYTNTAFGNTYLNQPEFAVYNLWLAEYVQDNPTPPDTWKTKGWTIWQRSEQGVIHGIDGNVDHDIFNGDLDAFKALFFNQ